jgi:Domain of unknown function (DUF4397)
MTNRTTARGGLVSRLTLVLVAALAASLAACGGGATDPSKAQLRLVNATGPVIASTPITSAPITSTSATYNELALRLDGQAVQGQVAYGETGTYAEVGTGSPAATLTRPASSAALLSFTPSLAKGKYTTVLAYGSERGNEGTLAQLALDDNADEPAANKSRLRAVNAAPDLGPLDVYLTGSAEALSTSGLVQNAGAVGAVSGFTELASGGWRLRVTPAGNKAEVLLDLPNVQLASRQVATVVVTPGPGGVLAHALVLTQRGSVQKADNTQARVRVVAGLADGGLVSVTVGGTGLLAGATSPTVGAYTAVAAGTQPVELRVAGSLRTAPAAVLQAGGDYTLLVHGTPAAPLQQWLVDTNTRPVSPTRLRMRLVNGVVGLTTPLGLTVDFAPVASGVAAGAASDYTELAASSKAQLAVTQPGASAPLFSAADRVLDAAATYTVLVVGSAAAPAGIVLKDR